MNSDHYRRLINKTEDYIEAHLNDKITLADVANYVNVSEFHFHRLFSKYSNETLKQFITRIKMERSAIFLVINSEMSITEIALKYGYNNASNYNKAFKKHYKMSPTEFRKEQEYIVYVHPLVLGDGIPLFPAGDMPLPLKLASKETFDTGLVRLHYTK